MNFSISHFNDINVVPEEIDILLNEHPAINFEAIGILEKLRENPIAFDGVLECIVVFEEDKIQVVTCRIKPYNLLISHTLNAKSIYPLVEYFIKNGISIPGIYGPFEEVILFSNLWKKNTGEDFQTSHEFLQYSLNEIKIPAKLIGDISTAKPNHKEMLKEWTENSIREIIPDTTEEFVKSCVKSFFGLLDESKVFILEVEKKLVSMAAISNQTKTMQAIIDVYTPLEHRGKGYATELCIFLSDYILNDCNNTPILWVKVTNHPAIHIYEKIGFEKVANMALCLKQN